MADEEQDQQSSSTISATSPVNSNLRRMRLEEANYRLLTEEDVAVVAAVSSTAPNAPSRIDFGGNRNGVVLSLSLSDSATRTKPEHVELALTQGEVHQMLSALRGMAATIASLTGE